MLCTVYDLKYLAMAYNEPFITAVFGSSVYLEGLTQHTRLVQMIKATVAFFPIPT